MISKVVGLAIKWESRGPIELLDAGYLSRTEGLQGDRNGSKQRRQVTVISLEQWLEACSEVDVNPNLPWPPPWEKRRANICVSNLVCGPELVGRHLAFSTRAILLVTGETRPCDRMDEIHPGLRVALAKNWREGFTCYVINDGPVEKGDIVALF